MPPSWTRACACSLHERAPAHAPYMNARLRMPPTWTRACACPLHERVPAHAPYMNARLHTPPTWTRACACPLHERVPAHALYTNACLDCRHVPCFPVCAAVEDEHGNLKLRLPNRLGVGTVKAASWQVRRTCMQSLRVCAPLTICHLHICTQASARMVPGSMLSVHERASCVAGVGHVS